MRVSETEMVIVDAGYDSLVPTRKLIQLRNKCRTGFVAFVESTDTKASGFCFQCCSQSSQTDDLCCFHLHCLKGIHNPFSVGVTEVNELKVNFIEPSLYYALSEKLGIKDKIFTLLGE